MAVVSYSCTLLIASLIPALMTVAVLEPQLPNVNPSGNDQLPSDLSTLTNFMLIENLPNSERQIFIRYQPPREPTDSGQNDSDTQNGTDGGESWMQMLTLSNSTQPGVSLLVTGDRDHVVKSIYRVDRQLLDCDLLTEEGAERARADFNSNIARLLSSGSYQFQRLNESVFSLTDEQKDWLNVTKQRHACRQLQHVVRRARRVYRRELRRHHRTPLAVDASNRHSTTITDDGLCDKWLPATASDGGHATDRHNIKNKAKRCCAVRKFCPFTIPAFSTEYNLFNYRIHTLIHCDCAEQLYQCLKHAATGEASLFGKIYFNFVNTECFTLKKKKVCKDRSWWGTCKAHKLVTEAVIDSVGQF